ncbi:MAG TPA: hypothetical protein VJ208_00985 [Candidatus Nanoarchaeia archaeon]|nr:hypothetical protein [Candidatus Nanoarchaeia archaeon]
MIDTINMQEMRYLNLFRKITQISTRFCFRYNDFIIFAVPRNLVSRAIGESGKNVKRISEIFGKKVKVVSYPSELHDVKRFIGAVVSPVNFKNLEINNEEIIITAGNQSKAALIGRDKARLHELQKISKMFFRRDLKIV